MDVQGPDTAVPLKSDCNRTDCTLCTQPVLAIATAYTERGHFVSQADAVLATALAAENKKVHCVSLMDGEREEVTEQIKTGAETHAVQA